MFSPLPSKTSIPSLADQCAFITESALACATASCSGVIFARRTGFPASPFHPSRFLPLKSALNPSGGSPIPSAASKLCSTRLRKRPGTIDSINALATCADPGPSFSSALPDAIVPAAIAASSPRESSLMYGITSLSASLVRMFASAPSARRFSSGRTAAASVRAW